MKNIQKLVSILAVGTSLFTFTPALAQTGVTADELLPTTIQPAIGLANTDIRVTIARIIRAAMAFIGIVILVLMLYAGFLWMTAGGNDEAIGKAKKIMTGAIIGLAIVLAAYSLTSFVINQLVQATT